METQPRAVEIDYTPYIYASEIPLFVREDLAKCDSIWVSVPSLPESATEFHLEWKYEWVPWEFKPEEPCISRKSILSRKYEFFGVGARDQCIESDLEWMRSVANDNQFTVFLTVGNTYKEGVVAETGNVYGCLQKSYCVLGRRKIWKKLKGKLPLLGSSTKNPDGQFST